MEFIGETNIEIITFLFSLVLIMGTFFMYKLITVWFIKTTPNLETLNAVLSRFPKKKQ